MDLVHLLGSFFSMSREPILLTYDKDFILMLLQLGGKYLYSKMVLLRVNLIY